MVGYLLSRPPCKEKERLSRHTSLGIGGAAEMFFSPETKAELTEEVSWLDSNAVDFRILGGGTNVACRDEGFEGAIINTRYLNRAWHEGASITAQAGCALALLVRRCCDLGLSGLEPLIGIPGTVGGAVAMNAGGRHGSIGSLVREVKTINGRGEERIYFKPEDRFDYRRGDFNGEIVLEVTLELKADSPSSIRRRMCRIMREKFSVQPLSARSAGCVFRNPPGFSAGKLIDQCGLKGRRVGGMVISPVHANFIVNESGGSFRDFRELARIATKNVKKEHGIDLEYEVKIL